MAALMQGSSLAATPWAPFDPAVDGTWNERRVRHLLRRAAFGGSDELVAELVAAGPAAAVDRLITGADDAADRRAASEQLARTVLANNAPKRLSAWWAYELITTPHPLRERMTLFWHGHFATGGDKVTDAEALYRQNRLFRDEALGDFRRLTHAVAQDPAMLIYLDSVTNRKAHPNENFARELMELFVLGEGNYTEADVQQLARCFTGWEVKQGRFRFNRYQHDGGEKSIMGKTDEFPDAEAVDWVIDQPSAPFFIVGKLYRLLVADEPQPSRELLAPLAQQLVDAEWRIEPVVRTMLASKQLLGDSAIGRKVRSPVDLAVGLLRSLDGITSSTALADDLLGMGMGLFFPPNVKGWDGGRTWISSATLLARANSLGRLIDHESTRFNSVSPSEYLSQWTDDPVRLVTELEQRLLAVTLPAATREKLIALGRGIDQPERRGRVVLQAMMSGPLAQLA